MDHEDSPKCLQQFTNTKDPAGGLRFSGVHEHLTERLRPTENNDDSAGGLHNCKTVIARFYEDSIGSPIFT